jgi:hypothetical protein
VGADPFFQAVIDRSQVEAGLERAEGVLHKEELFVSQGDVLRGEGVVRGAQQVLAVQPLFRLNLGAVVNAGCKLPLIIGRKWDIFGRR